MAISYTTQQQKVIDARDCNVLVSAAAGSGKTAVLVERIIRLICDETQPVDVDRLLVVTFTAAAAAQMRERIGQAIERKLEENPWNEHLQRQSALLHNAQITTIHSFCLFVIRNHFHTIGLDPAFRVADEAQLKLLKQEVMKDLLEERFAQKEQIFTECVEYFCLNGRESVLEGHILDLYTFAMSYPWPEEWLAERKTDYRCDNVEAFCDSQVGRYFTALLRSRTKDLYDLMKRALEICELPDGPYMYGELLERELTQIEKLCKLDTPEEFERYLPAVSFAALPRKKDDTVDPQKREAVKEIRTQVKDGLKELENKFFSVPFSMSMNQQKECSRMLEVLIDLVLEFKERLDAAKREKKLIDFHDIEHFALDILLERTEEGIRSTAAAEEYRNYFKEVLIDEYQDSNMVQEYLLKAVSGEEEGIYNRFMVGDVKQSIYRFRLAKPALFLEKYHTYEMETGRECRIDLRQNFRSRKEVLSGVNLVFEKIMTVAVGGIAYDENAALYPAAVYPDNEACFPELILVETPEKEAEISAKEAEALAISQKIRELKKNFQVTDEKTGELRPVQYKDMVILLRSISGWDEEFKRVLQKEGIPAYVMSATGYFAVGEVQTILHFLKVLDNPLQDIPFYGVMTSVFGGFTEEETALIRARNKSVPLYKCVEECEQENPKCKALLESIRLYRRESVYLPVSRLLQKIMKDFAYIPYVSALPGGRQRRANVEMLLEKAIAFEAVSFSGLFQFIRYIEQLDKYDIDYGEANILDENADVVRIMSIHKSKGLEFPITFVAGMGKRFNRQDSTQAFLVDDDLGIGMNYVNLEQRVKCRTLRRNILSAKMQSDSLAEELRILYVAMTRAKEKLILTGTMTKPQENCQKEELKQTMRNGRPLSAYELLCASCYWDFLLPSMGEWKSTIINSEKLLENQVRERIEEKLQKEKLKGAERLADASLCARLEQAFSYRYPHTNLETLYTKTTVSELKMASMKEKQEETYDLFEEKEIVPYIPNFRRKEETVSGTLRGSAVHKVMELIDFTQCPSQEGGIRQYLQTLSETGYLPEEYLELVSVGKIKQFLDSSLAKRMCRAAERDELYKEQPFVYGIRADRLSETFPAEETVLIQGIIDVFFEEDGELVLMDYKTDVIHKPQELRDRYEAQLHYYEEALEKMTGKRVKERILYSFYLGCEVDC